MDSGEIKVDGVVDSAQPFTAFERTAAEAPRSSFVLPRTIFPSGSSRAAAGASVSFRKIYSGRNNDAVLRGDFCLLHDQFDLVCLVLAGIIFYDLLKSLVVAADDLLAGSLAACLVIEDAETGHVDTHIGRDLYGHSPKIPSKMALEHRIDPQRRGC